jgi:glycosidase
MNNTLWYQDAIFYHIYPLGLCGAPEHNPINAPVEDRLEQLFPWLEHARSLGANALYLGPVFESSTHGYDTRDYYQVDRRLGDNPAFARFAEHVHQYGMRLVLDAVFNHVGRDFWAFRDVLEKGEDSLYVDWFTNLRFGKTSPKGDPFRYEGWQGHFDLVKLNLSHPDVRAHLFDAVALWMDQFGADGLRLDAADCIDFDFLRALRDFVKTRRHDFWLMGEVVHGNYRDWTNPETLDSVTNYASYKGLYSSLNDDNYFEIAHTLENQFGEQGRFKDLHLYNFVDNHDVDRVASKLTHYRHLYPLYLLLYSMPGIPSVYYGSEWGIEGVKGLYTDAPLRPKLVLNAMDSQSPQPDLLSVIRRLGDIRQKSPSLRHGDFQKIHVDHQQLAFLRQTPEETILVVLNSAAQSVALVLPLPGKGHEFIDLLEPDAVFHSSDGSLQVLIPPSWGRLLKCVQ